MPWGFSHVGCAVNNRSRDNGSACFSLRAHPSCRARFEADARPAAASLAPIQGEPAIWPRGVEIRTKHERALSSLSCPGYRVLSILILTASSPDFLSTRPKSFWTKRESAPDGDDPKTEDRIPAYDGEKALQEIAATRLLLVSAIASAVTPIVRIVAAISFRVGRFATLNQDPKDCGMVMAYEYPSRFSADRRFLGLHCCTWRSPTPGQTARRPFFALPIGGRH